MAMSLHSEDELGLIFTTLQQTCDCDARQGRTNSSASIFSRIGVQKAEDDRSSEIQTCFISAVLHLHSF